MRTLSWRAKSTAGPNSDVPAIADTDLQERDFGTWELREWDAIFAEVGQAMDGLLLDPANYAQRT